MHLAFDTGMSFFRRRSLWVLLVIIVAVAVTLETPALTTVSIAGAALAVVLAVSLAVRWLRRSRGE